jgi:hypothetical protein
MRIAVAFSFVVVVAVGAGHFLSGCDQWDDQLTPVSLLDASADGAKNAPAHGDGAVNDAAADRSPRDAGSLDAGTHGPGSGDVNDAGKD